MSEAIVPTGPLCDALEAILFVAGEPVALRQLAKTLDRSEDDVRTALDVLTRHYRVGGLRIALLDGHAQMTTAPETSRYIEAFLGISYSAQLSRAALETLAIVVYRQPITRGEIEAVRGVNAGGVLSTLQNRGLVAEVGRRDTVGRPILYGVTIDFLQHFGLERLSDLPPLPALSATEIGLQ